MTIKFVAMTTRKANHYKNGGKDAYGNSPEKLISDGNGNPCRHCLNDIAEGKSMLALSYRPFSDLQPYAETGPVLLCGDECKRFDQASHLPPSISQRNEFIIRGYSVDEKIVEGTGGVVATTSMMEKANSFLQLQEVASVHVRSATNNCFFCSIIED